MKSFKKDLASIEVSKRTLWLLGLTLDEFKKILEKIYIDIYRHTKEDPTSSRSSFCKNEFLHKEI